MPAQRAIAAFKTRQPNCAQSVLRAFQREHGVTEDKIAQAQHLGGGRADGGRCGALHAACELVEHEAVRGSLRTAFAAKAGSELCREIRKSKTLSCEQCVELAAELVASLGKRK